MTLGVEPVAAHDRPDSVSTFARAAAGVSVALGALVLLGWVFDIDRLKSIGAGWPMMKANTALAFVLSGISLWLCASKGSRTAARARHAARWIAGAVFALAGATLLEWLTDRSFGIDQALFTDVLKPGLLVAPGRMAPQSAASFALIGLVLVAMRHPGTERQRAVEGFATLPVLFLGALGLTNYLYSVPSDGGPFGYPPLPVLTSIGLLLLGIGTLAARGTSGLLGIVVSRSAGGRVARQVMPWIVVVPLGAGWLLLAGERAALYSKPFGDNLLAVVSVLMLLVLAWWTARSVDQADVELTRSTQELEISEFRYRQFFEGSPVALYRTKLDGEILAANAALARLLGYPNGAAIAGRHARDHYAVETAREEFRVMLDQSGVVERHVVELKHVDGTTFWAIDTAAVVRGPHGEVLHYEGCLVDITNLRDAERRLQASERRFRALIDRSVDGISLSGRDGVIHYSSPAIHRILGWTPEECVGRPFAELIHPDDLERANTTMRDVIGTPASAETVEVRVRHADGNWRWIEATATNLLDDPAVGCLVVNYRDVTERKNAAAALKESEARFIQAQRMEAVGRLAGGVAHDFNNLLTVIVSATEMVHARLPANDDDRAMLGEVLQASASATGLTRQLLAFSRRQLVEPVVLDINDLVSATARLLRRLIGEDIQLDTRLDSDVGCVCADRAQLEQVLANLAVNARDAMPRGGVLSISSSRATLDAAYAASRDDVSPGEYVMLTVSDTGGGMSQEVIDHAFEPFFTTKESGQGTGLGLATCHGIVRQAGGHFTVNSERGVGTTFRIYLPHVAGGLLTASAARETPRGGHERILVVEDHAAVRRVAQRMLTAAGYDVTVARSAEIALEVLETPGQRVDLLFTDVVLPGMGGRELAEAARLTLPGLKVLYSTGYTADVTLHHRLIAHDVSVLQKPYTAEQLTSKIREVLDRG